MFFFKYKSSFPNQTWFIFTFLNSVPVLLHMSLTDSGQHCHWFIIPQLSFFNIRSIPIQNVPLGTNTLVKRLLFLVDHFVEINSTSSLLFAFCYYDFLFSWPSWKHSLILYTFYLWDITHLCGMIAMAGMTHCAFWELNFRIYTTSTVFLCTLFTESYESYFEVGYHYKITD